MKLAEVLSPFFVVLLLTSHHSGLGGIRDGCQNSQRFHANQATRDANLSHVYPQGLGFDNLNTSELWGACEDGMEEPYETDPASPCQPVNPSVTSGSIQSSPEISEADPNVKNHVWIRGGHEKAHKRMNHLPPKSHMAENTNNQDDVATDSSRIPQSNTQLNDTQLPQNDAAYTFTFRDRGTLEERLCRRASSRARERQQERERIETEDEKRIEELRAKLAKMQIEMAKIQAEIDAIEIRRAAFRASLFGKEW